MKTIFLWSKILKKLETRNKKKYHKKISWGNFLWGFLPGAFFPGEFFLESAATYCYTASQTMLVFCPLSLFSHFFFEKKTAFQR